MMARLFWRIYVQPISAILVEMLLLPIIWVAMEKKVRKKPWQDIIWTATPRQKG